MRLYDSAVSGNCYKVRLLLSRLGREYEKIEVDVLDRSNRLQLLGDKNPVLRIPVLELDDGRCIGESNAILCYLGTENGDLPDDPYDRALVLQWLFFEQNQHEPNIAVARYLVSIARQAERYPKVVAARQRDGRRALENMERHLASHDFLAANRYSIADIALYAYTHVASEGGFDLDEFPAVQRWLDRVASQPRHVPMRDANG